MQLNFVVGPDAESVWPQNEVKRVSLEFTVFFVHTLQAVGYQRMSPDKIKTLLHSHPECYPISDFGWESDKSTFTTKCCCAFENFHLKRYTNEVRLSV